PQAGQANDRQYQGLDDNSTQEALVAASFCNSRATSARGKGFMNTRTAPQASNSCSCTCPSSLAVKQQRTLGSSFFSSAKTCNPPPPSRCRSSRIRSTASRQR